MQVGGMKLILTRSRVVMGKNLCLIAAFMVVTFILSVRVTTSEALSTRVAMQSSNCPVVLPATTVQVAPGQPAVGTVDAATPDSSGKRTATPTAGIINALCSVRLSFVGCSFSPDTITLGCDTNGDGVPDLSVKLTDVTQVDADLVQATLSTAASGIPGSCFILPDGTTNVTSVFAVDKSDATNIIQATRFVVLTPNLIDAAFDLGSDNAGKVFYIYAKGPSGTSRNLITLPSGALACVPGNELGVPVTFSCAASQPAPQSNVAVVNGCFQDRAPSGKFLLTITGGNIQQGATVRVGAGQPRKIKFTQYDSVTNTYGAVVASGGICGSLPGLIVITNPNGSSSLPFQCNRSCDQ